MNACVFACADRREVRRTNKGEGGRKSDDDERRVNSLWRSCARCDEDRGWRADAR
jgi:hypothetical protein